MKTIEIKIGEQIAQFTTKSVTFRGKEFFYSKMTDVARDPDSSTYSFIYDGELIVFPYEEKDLKVLSIIFNQVKNLPPKNHEKRNENTETKKSSEAGAHKDTQDIDRAYIDGQASQEENAAQNITEKSTEEGFSSDTETAQQKDVQSAPETEDRKVKKQEEKERRQEEKARKKAEKQRLKAKKKAMKNASSVNPSENEAGSESNEAGDGENTAASDVNENVDGENTAASEGIEAGSGENTSGVEGESISTETQSSDSEAKNKIKKSLIIFAGIIGIVAVLAVAYYFIFGTSSNPSAGPNSTESQQYDDIDELIDDLQ